METTNRTSGYLAGLSSGFRWHEFSLWVMNTHIFPFESSVSGKNAWPAVLSPCADLQPGNYTLAKNKYEDTNHISLSHNVIYSFGRKWIASFEKSLCLFHEVTRWRMSPK